MSHIRILGPREDLEVALSTLQDLGVLHLTPPEPRQPLGPLPRSTARVREREHLERIAGDIETTFGLLPGGARPELPAQAPPPAFPRWARLARRARREVEALAGERTRLDEERALIARYRSYFEAFEPLLRAQPEWPDARSYHLILHGSDAGLLPELEARMSEALRGRFGLLTSRLEGGDVAVALLVPAAASSRVEGFLREAGVQEIPIPPGYGGDSLATVMPRMETRRAEVIAGLREIRTALRKVARERGPELAGALIATRDRLLELDALAKAACTEGAFVLEGWLPAAQVPRLERRLESDFAGRVIAEHIATEKWSGDAPVVLTNPRIFRPFEAITRLFPLPRYGSIDPTPFVAVFFPMFFGLILGDIGYGVALVVLALVLRAKSEPGTPLRSVSEIAGACAVFTIIFGLLYGELLGDLGRRLLGLRPLAFDRQEAFMPFLVLAVGLGVIHIVLGLVLGALAAFRGSRRESLGRGIAALMVTLAAVALLAAMRILPGGFFTPSVIALLIAFPILVIVEGVLAPVELVSTLGNILSYARIMALGTASVMMAVVANRMVGAVGSAVVGVLFGLIFHIVNFALGIFAPTVHGLRLHYVEFFGKFYSPGGVAYDPFGHWRSNGAT